MAEETPKITSQAKKHATGFKIAGGIAGAVVAYILWKQRQAANAATAAAGTTDGQTTPSAGSGSPTTVSQPTSLPGWIEAALGSNTTLNYQAPALLNDINAWLSGSCVSAQGYNTIANLVETLGVPPGYQTAPSLMVCPNAQGTGSGSGSGSGGGGSTPAAISSAMQVDLNQEIGTLSNITGHNATKTQVAQWEAEAQKLGLTPGSTAYWEYIQSQNVGTISQGLKWPSLTSVKALAVTLAGGQTAFSKMTSQQQQYYEQVANVQLLTQLNPKTPAKA